MRFSEKDYCFSDNTTGSSDRLTPYVYYMDLPKLVASMFYNINVTEDII